MDFRERRRENDRYRGIWDGNDESQKIAARLVRSVARTGWLKYAWSSGKIDTTSRTHKRAQIDEYIDRRFSDACRKTPVYDASDWKLFGWTVCYVKVDCWTSFLSPPVAGVNILRPGSVLVFLDLLLVMQWKWPRCEIIFHVTARVTWKTSVYVRAWCDNYVEREKFFQPYQGHISILISK